MTPKEPNAFLSSEVGPFFARPNGWAYHALPKECPLLIDGQFDFYGYKEVTGKK